MKTFYWMTEDECFDNEDRLDDFLLNCLDQKFEIISINRSYAEIKDTTTGEMYGCNASGNGDFYSHKVEFELIKMGSC